MVYWDDGTVSHASTNSVMTIGFPITPVDCVSFPSPAWPERGGFGNEAEVRENICFVELIKLLLIAASSNIQLFVGIEWAQNMNLLFSLAELHTIRHDQA